MVDPRDFSEISVNDAMKKGESIVEVVLLQWKYVEIVLFFLVEMKV